MTVYYPLKCNGTYETFPYDFFGSMKAFRSISKKETIRKRIKFIVKCKLSYSACDRLCDRLNRKIAKKK